MNRTPTHPAPAWVAPWLAIATLIGIGGMISGVNVILLTGEFAPIALAIYAAATLIAIVHAVREVVL